MKRAIAFLFILIGIGVMLYPTATDYYNSYKQNNLIEDWESQEIRTENNDQINQNPDEQEARSNYISLDGIFDSSENTVEAAERETSPNDNDLTETEDKQEPLKENILGIITIDKINVKLPILRGASQYHLKYGAGHLSGTVLPGHNGNSAIAAHRSRQYGKMFNRLNEVEKGDLIKVRTREGTFEYKILSTKIVKPDNLSVLQNSDEPILTLITCDPVDNPINRLIIRAEMQ
ncbi:class D sortase [Bacillus sp. AK031]